MYVYVGKVCKTDPLQIDLTSSNTSYDHTYISRTLHNWVINGDVIVSFLHPPPSVCGVKLCHIGGTTQKMKHCRFHLPAYMSLREWWLWWLWQLWGWVVEGIDAGSIVGNSSFSSKLVHSLFSCSNGGMAQFLWQCHRCPTVLSWNF